jgi:hypothetical protein
MGAKGVLLDSMGRCSVVCAGLLYAGAFLLFVIVGATGPSPTLTASNPRADISTPCPVPSSCEVTWLGALTDMSPHHQMMWVEMEMERPVEKVTGRPALAFLEVTFPLQFAVNVTGVAADGTEQAVVRDSRHTAMVTCPAGSPVCRKLTLFTQPLVKWPTFRIVAAFSNPTAAFASAPIDATVNMKFDMGFVSQAFTTFELGAKMFFVTCGGIFWLAYTVLLFTGPGVKDEATGARLSSTYEQRYVWFLGLFSILFNDPLFALAVDNPTIELAGFNAFCVVTFLAALLTFWLVQFDLARIQGEGGLSFEIDPARTKLGVCFWLPKVVFASVFWSISIASYMWLRISQINDPGYDPVEAFPLVAKWFASFIATIVSLYLLYLFALAVLSCRRCGTMRPANRFIFAITLFTLLMCTVGIFLNAFTPVRSDAALLLTAYGAPNLYVWTLLFANLPAPKAPQWVHDMLADGGKAGGEQLAHDEAVTADTGGVLGGEDDGVAPEDVAVDGFDEGAAAYASAPRRGPVPTPVPAVARAGAGRGGGASAPQQPRRAAAAAAAVARAPGPAVRPSGPQSRAPAPRRPAAQQQRIDVVDEDANEEDGEADEELGAHGEDGGAYYDDGGDEGFAIGEDGEDEHAAEDEVEYEEEEEVAAAPPPAPAPRSQARRAQPQAPAASPRAAVAQPQPQRMAPQSSQRGGRGRRV